MAWKTLLRAPDLLSTRLWTRFNKPSLTTTLALIAAIIAVVDVIVISVGMIVAAGVH